MLRLIKNNPFATFILIAAFGFILQLLAEELKEHISFGMQLFIMGYVVMAIGAAGSFITLMTKNSKANT
jgi:hypothetical protein